MRAIRISNYGGPEVLKLETNVPIPSPGPNEVFYNNGMTFHNFIDGW
jgi:NADPH:quinone reductase-like Zn-dependent oxidoreductase